MSLSENAHVAAIGTLTASVVGLAASAAVACDATTACETPNGTYLIEQADNGAPLGAVVFLHGYGGSAEGTMRNRRLVDDITARGYAFVAPNGSDSVVAPGRRSWSFFPGRPERRDETAFFSDLFDEISARHGIDRDRIIMGGFSAGGFMTTYLACSHPDLASAWVPVSGGFWRPHPVSCTGPVRLFHTHGWTDTVVPLEGRFLRNGEFAQGDIFHGMDIWRQTNGCDAMRADSFETVGAMWVRSWERCDAGSALDFALFPGGHTVPAGWGNMMLDWYEALPISAAIQN